MAFCKCIIGERVVSTVCTNRRGLPSGQRVNTLTGSRWPGNAAPWGASITGRLFSPIVEDCQNVVNIADAVGASSLYSLCSGPGHLRDRMQAPRNRVGAVTHVDLETSWRAPWNGVFTLDARNALDRNPPLARSYNTFNSFIPDHDIPGRFYYANYRQKF